MKNVNIVRAWKDQAYFASLTAEEKAMVPANPAGSIELSGMDAIVGGRAAAKASRLAASCTSSNSTCC